MPGHHDIVIMDHADSFYNFGPGYTCMVVKKMLLFFLVSTRPETTKGSLQEVEPSIVLMLVLVGAPALDEGRLDSSRWAGSES